MSAAPRAAHAEGTGGTGRGDRRIRRFFSILWLSIKSEPDNAPTSPTERQERHGGTPSRQMRRRRSQKETNHDEDSFFPSCRRGGSDRRSRTLGIAVS